MEILPQTRIFLPGPCARLSHSRLATGLWYKQARTDGRMPNPARHVR